MLGNPEPPFVPGTAGGTGSALGGTGIDVVELLPLDPVLLVEGLPIGTDGSDGVIGLGGVNGVAPGMV
jgi:hypothetical protein